MRIQKRGAGVYKRRRRKSRRGNRNGEVGGSGGSAGSAGITSSDDGTERIEGGRDYGNEPDEE